MHIYFMILGYEPDKNIHFSTVWVWEQLGRCEGTFSPTPNPINAYDDIGGCYCEYDADKTYAAGDRVSKREDGAQVVYECKNSPVDQWCDMIVRVYSILAWYLSRIVVILPSNPLSRYPTLINQIQTYEPGEGLNFEMVSVTHLVFFFPCTMLISPLISYIIISTSTFRHGILLERVTVLSNPPPPQVWTILMMLMAALGNGMTIPNTRKVIKYLSPWQMKSVHQVVNLASLLRLLQQVQQFPPRQM